MMPDNNSLDQIKELLEVVKHKVDNLELAQHATAGLGRMTKDQLSVVNKKLDDMKSTLDTNTTSVVEIEKTLKAYGEMYNVNQDYIGRLDNRVITVEKHLDIEPPEDQKIPHFSAE